MSIERLSFLINEVLKHGPLSDKGFKLLGVGSEKMVFETTGSERKIFKVNKSDVFVKVLKIIENKIQHNNRENHLERIEKTLKL